MKTIPLLLIVNLFWFACSGTKNGEEEKAKISAKENEITANETVKVISKSDILHSWKYREAKFGIVTQVSFREDSTFKLSVDSHVLKGTWKWVNDTVITLSNSRLKEDMWWEIHGLTDSTLAIFRGFKRRSRLPMIFRRMDKK